MELLQIYSKSYLIAPLPSVVPYKYKWMYILTTSYYYSFSNWEH